MQTAEQVFNNVELMTKLEILKVQDVQTVIAHLSNQELLEEIQEQAGVIQDAQMFITAATQLLFERG